MAVMRKSVGLSTSTSRPEPPTWRWAWHGWANALVLGWLALTVITATGATTAEPWLAVHLFLLGAVTTAIVVWSEHFSVALLHAQAPDRRWSAARLALLTTGQAAVLAGVSSDVTVLLAAGATVVTAAIAAHAYVLLRMRLRSLGGRLAPLVDYYLLACAALLAGAPMGALLGSGVGGAAWHERLHLAHAHLNIGGWVLLTVVGTLFMLWPSAVGTTISGVTHVAARWCLRALAAGLVVAVVGMLAGSPLITVVGVGGYAVGVLVAMVPFAATLLHRRPVSGAAWLLGGSIGWLLVAVVADLVLIASGASGDGLALLGPMLLVGVIGQVLIGSLTFLLPVVMGGGPAAVSRAREHLHRGWAVRIGTLNAGVAGLALSPAAGWAGPVGLILVLGVGADFVLRAGWLIAPTLARLGVRGRITAFGSAAVLTVTAIVVAVAFAGPVPLDGAAHEHAAGGAHAAGPAGARTVEVALSGMRATPAVIEVPAGTRLVLSVTNTDSQRHDLRVDGGPRTPLLRKGQQASLDVGVVAADVKAWCAVPGHRAAGMALTIKVGGAAAAAQDHSGHTTATGPVPDPGAAYSTGFTAHDAVLPPAPTGRLHRVELPVVDKEIEVAPGLRQRSWTFGGSVPGPTLRGRVGDEFEITLVNQGTLGHSIDFHAGATAPDGMMRTIEPGERLVYRFVADKAGAWLYHCGTMPMTQHISAGMFGAVIIDPPDLAPVDREYVVVASELYHGEPGGEAVTAALRAGTPDGWVFNGSANQYDSAPLPAKVGERVRFWVVSAGPGSRTAFHVVGTRFDTVYREGAYLLRPGAGAAQVLDLAPAQGGFVEMTFAEPGGYPFVDHDMRHAEAGAHGVIRVTA
ncbi:hypothetical protein CS0771_64690 [Catellatospora sp. IY07-71]|nr:hypothetical protein CS0771_64690 [Catellatospora sp. IY07-71]